MYFFFHNLFDQMFGVAFLVFIHFFSFYFVKMKQFIMWCYTIILTFTLEISFVMNFISIWMFYYLIIIALLLYKYEVVFKKLDRTFDHVLIVKIRKLIDKLRINKYIIKWTLKESNGKEKFYAIEMRWYIYVCVCQELLVLPLLIADKYIFLHYFASWLCRFLILFNR